MPRVVIVALLPLLPLPLPRRQHLQRQWGSASWMMMMMVVVAVCMMLAVDQLVRATYPARLGARCVCADPE